MSSPFSTIEAFNTAADGPTEGAIYTFANAPVLNNIALIASVGIFCWFIVSTYATHSKPPAINKSLDHLSSFIVIGLLSLVVADYRRPANVEQTAQRTTAQTAIAQSSQPSRRAAPLGLLGIISMGLPSRAKGRKGRYLRNRQR